jgi:hypothetical protein
LPGVVAVTARLAWQCLAATLAVAGAVSMVAAQSSASYSVRNVGPVTTAGSASSATFTARLVGGDGGSHEVASSQQYAVVVGAGNDRPANAAQVFTAGFEPRY